MHADGQRSTALQCALCMQTCARRVCTWELLIGQFDTVVAWIMYNTCAQNETHEWNFTSSVINSVHLGWQLETRFHLIWNVRRAGDTKKKEIEEVDRGRGRLRGRGRELEIKTYNSLVRESVLRKGINYHIEVTMLLSGFAVTGNALCACSEAGFCGTI